MKTQPHYANFLGVQHLRLLVKTKALVTTGPSCLVIVSVQRVLLVAPVADRSAKNRI